MRNVALVAEPGPLAELFERLDAAPQESVALDTEADSFHHYFEKVCLVQLGLASGAFLVDPLARADLAPLFARLSARPLLMHGADYDLRLLHRGWGFRAASLFDTMIAAQLLGEKEIGLAALLAARVGVALDKSHQRADWSARPLPEAMAAYAAEDVLHLPALVDSLRRDLDAKGRLSWHAEECARLAAATFSAAREPDPDGWRVKGTNALSDRERAFARALWKAREERARTLDRPPFRIFTNEKLLAAAARAARGERDPAVLFPFFRPLAPAFTHALRSALAAAAALPESDLPRVKRGEKVPPDPALDRDVEGLKKIRDAKAQALGLDPGVLASKAALTAAARVRRTHGALTAELLVSAAGLSRWRAELLAGGR